MARRVRMSATEQVQMDAQFVEMLVATALEELDEVLVSVPDLPPQLRDRFLLGLRKRLQQQLEERALHPGKTAELVRAALSQFEAALGARVRQ